MPSKNSKTIAIRVTDGIKERFDNELRHRDLTPSKLIEAFVLASEGDEVDFIDGCIYSKDCENEPEHQDRIHRNLERFVETLMDKGYPESAIIQVTEQILDGAKGVRRYNPKRARISDTGC